VLISFAVTNYACFKERQELTLAPPRKTDDDEFTFDTGVRRVPRLHRAAALYGANASGKSRLIQALAFVDSFVIGSSKRRQTGEPIPHEPFRFDAECRARPTAFEISFVQAGSLYEYGFSVDGERVDEEWLLQWPDGGRQRMLLDRERNPETGEESWTFGASVRGEKRAWQASTRPDTLLVSTAAQLNSEVFAPVVEWFQRTLRVVPAGGLLPAGTIAMIDGNERATDRVLKMLRDADIAVSSLRTRKESVRLDDLRPSAPAEILREFREAGHTTVNLWEADLGHRPEGSAETFFLDLDEESDGTQRLFALAGSWLDALDNDLVVVVDELDSSMHSHLTEALIRRINSSRLEGEGRRSQLVATLHDTSPMKGALDRDQIWLVDKDAATEASSLTPLSAFRPRRREPLDRGYLGGRYGGVPVIAEYGYES